MPPIILRIDVFRTWTSNNTQTQSWTCSTRKLFVEILFANYGATSNMKRRCRLKSHLTWVLHKSSCEELTAMSCSPTCFWVRQFLDLAGNTFSHWEGVKTKFQHIGTKQIIYTTPVFLWAQEKRFSRDVQLRFLSLMFTRKRVVKMLYLNIVRKP